MVEILRSISVSLIGALLHEYPAARSAATELSFAPLSSTAIVINLLINLWTSSTRRHLWFF